MRYLIAARVRPEKRDDLLHALEAGTFGQGFPYGDLGVMLCAGRVDASGTIRWVEVCYCREYYGVAMDEELPYIEEFLTDITIADTRSPDLCEGYPACNDCDCTRKTKLGGEPLLDSLKRAIRMPGAGATHAQRRATQWLGWRGQVCSGEAARNRAAACHSTEAGADR